METPPTIIPEFKIYNRYQELARREREKKEQDWEKELQLAMESSEPFKEDTDPKIQKCTGCKLESMINSKNKQLYTNTKMSCNETDVNCKEQLKLPEKQKIDDKLQNIDYIDRTPSPVERLDAT